MDAVELRPPDPERKTTIWSPLPELLQTPAGFAILEIQGTIHLPGQNVTSDTDATAQVGKIVFPLYSSETPDDDHAWMKRVYLYVGKHQRLTGEVKKLAKPIAIIRKGQGPKGTDDNGEEHMEIAEVVRFKIIFSQRPEPVGQDSAP